MNESIADGDTLQGTWSPSRAQLGVSATGDNQQMTRDTSAPTFVSIYCPACS
ncbi:hypothetical protein N9459_05450 [Flavobacteriaceae bacterium]|nr:hypothetical protein [Flavobacteriaceae bacterium]